MEKILLLYWSKTGNTKTFIDYFVKHSTAQVDVVDANKEEITNEMLNKYNKICIGCYTWNNGKIAPRAKKFIVNHMESLSFKDIFIFGSGNTVYTYFAAAVDNLEIIFNDLQCDVKYKLKFDHQFHEKDFTEQEITELKKAIQRF